MKPLFHNQLLFVGLFLAVLSVQTACTTPNSLISKGRYEDALTLAAKRLHKSKKKDKDILVAERAFKTLQKRDLERIEFLRKDGQPSSWEEITEIYRKIKIRQARVQDILPLNIAAENRQADIKLMDIDDELIGSKKNAATYLYAHAEELLNNSEKTGDRTMARDAYAELFRIDQYYKDFRDKETLKTKAKNLGTSQVYFKMQNSSDVIMPADFEREILTVGTNNMNREWVQFSTRKEEGKRYDYEVITNVTQVAVSPEQANNREYVDSKIIEDGFEYVYDKKGNVMKDSLGNDIKIPKKVTIQATVFEAQQRKTSRVQAAVLIYRPGANGSRGELLKNIPVTADGIFENYAATFRGDKRALTNESRNKLGNAPKPFPSNPDIIMLAADRMKQLVKQAVSDNERLFEQGSRRP